MFCRSHLFRHCRTDFSFTFQIRSIIGQLFTPIHTGIAIFISQLLTTCILVVTIQQICIECTTARCIHINPHNQMLPFVVGQLHIMMSTFQHTNNLTGRSMVLIRAHDIHIRFRPLAVHIRMESQITLLEITCTAPVGNTYGCRILEVRTFRFASIVASHTSTIKNGLNLISESIRANAAFRYFQFMRLTGRSLHAFRNGILVFMATDTRNDFARHTGQPATHPLYGTSVFIQRLQRNRCIGWNLKDSRAVFLHRNCTQQTLDIPSCLDTVVIMIG